MTLKLHVKKWVGSAFFRLSLMVDGKTVKKAGLIDKSGSIIADPIFDLLTLFGESYVAVKNGMYGLVNDRGDIILYPEYDSFYFDNEDGYFVFSNVTTWYIVNDQGEIMF